MKHTMESLAETIMFHGGPLNACQNVKTDELPDDAILRMDWEQLQRQQDAIWTLEAEIAARVLTREQMHRV